jgi:hypothetical protein
MDTGLVVKAAVGAVHADYARPAPAPVQQAVPTDLSPGKSVTVASEVTAPRNDMPRPQDTFTHDVLLDPQSREVVYRVIDVRSRQVVRQIPEEAFLRMRAYSRAIASGQSPQEAQNHADLQA